MSPNTNATGSPGRRPERNLPGAGPYVAVVGVQIHCPARPRPTTVRHPHHRGAVIRARPSTSQARPQAHRPHTPDRRPPRGRLASAPCATRARYLSACQQCVPLRRCAGGHEPLGLMGVEAVSGRGTLKVTAAQFPPPAQCCSCTNASDARRATLLPKVGRRAHARGFAASLCSLCLRARVCHRDVRDRWVAPRLGSLVPT
ncbi:hypothetical protein C8Q77DRAFT_403319 [Trametes polyzona]|nr:hypothetical protein C8Q77DRAFT_403319 [Trametes polyzona]